MSENKLTTKTIGEVYLHVFNGGTTFKVIDDGKGPTIEICSHLFGNMQNTFTLDVDKEGLEALSKMFGEASKCEYSEESYHKAEIMLGKKFAAVSSEDCCENNK